MKKYRNFLCQYCEHVEEKRVDDDVKSIECPKCSSTANRVISAPKCFQNTVGKSPSLK